ncbi:hypothetical protein GCM10009415_41180 [Chitinophaga japonensis]
MEKYGWNPTDWTIFLEDSEIFATPDRKMLNGKLPFNIIPRKSEKNKLYGRRSVIEVDDGYLVGFYRGEWGGNLFWFSKNGKRRYEISDHEIVQFIIRENRVYAIEGLSHLNISKGSLIEIKKIDNKWSAVNYAALPAAPDGIDLDRENNFIIITSSDLLLVDATGKINTIESDGFWRGLYPTSILLKNNCAYIGMRGGILKFDLSSHDKQWLTPD